MNFHQLKLSGIFREMICTLKAPFLILIMVVFAATGCSLFETRQAELPEDGSTGVFLQPDRAEVVLDNLISAIQNLNTLNYIRCLSEDRFTFAPSNAALTTNPDIWVNWTVDQEQTYFNNMRAASESTTGHQLRLSNISNELSAPNQRQIVADYSLTVFHNRTGMGIPTNLGGRFILELESGEDGLWSIISWTDVGQGSNFSWSDLRASFLSD
jgi:hypothetical protein